MYPQELRNYLIYKDVCDTAVNLTDIGVTLEHMVSGEAPARPHDSWRPRSLLDLAEHPDPSRCVLSEYHDGGSPCGFALFQRGPHKLTRYADGNPDQFFDTDADPHEERDRAADDLASYRSLSQALDATLDIDACNRAALTSQRDLLDALGGEAALAKLAAFNHTPVGS